MAPNPKNLLDSAVALGGKAVSAAGRALGRDGDDKRDDLTSEPPENVKPVSVPRAGGAKTGRPAARSTATARRKAAAKPSGSATAASGSKRPAAAKASSSAAKAKAPGAKPAAAKKSGAAGASRTSGTADKGVSGDSRKA